MKLTIDEIKIKKAELEYEIFGLLREFEARTKTKIKDLDIERVGIPRVGNFIAKVEIEITL